MSKFYLVLTSEKEKYKYIVFSDFALAKSYLSVNLTLKTDKDEQYTSAILELDFSNTSMIAMFETIKQEICEFSDLNCTVTDAVIVKTRNCKP